jgi:hypothetical protein
MDKVQKHNSFNTNTPSSESYKNYLEVLFGDRPLKIMQIFFIKDSSFLGELNVTYRHAKYFLRVLNLCKEP